MTVPKVKEESIAIDTLETAAWWFAVVVRRIYNARKIPEVNLNFCVCQERGPRKRSLREVVQNPEVEEVLPGKPFLLRYKIAGK